MNNNRLLSYIQDVMANMPADWLGLTTHRLDIYDEALAKTQFVEQLQELYEANNANPEALMELPTAYDYIRLGHPLSCLLEWAIARSHELDPSRIISFASRTMPIMAVLRENRIKNKATRILHAGELPASFDADILRRVYGYQFDLVQVKPSVTPSAFGGSTIYVLQNENLWHVNSKPNIDFCVHVHPYLGSVMVVLGKENESYIPRIQHVRRRETIAMTPADALTALQEWVGQDGTGSRETDRAANKQQVLDTIAAITGADTNALMGSSGLSIQYAIMMGLIHHAQEVHPGKAIKFVVPPNCYGGTNDQARRVAASIPHVDVVDLPVDSEHNMVQSTDDVLSRLAKEDAVPYIIAEIPTNPRVEVPDLAKLQEALSTPRTNASGQTAIAPVFILDQTFCPNVQFLAEDGPLSGVKTISYVSGSKFPSGGRCTAGYCVGNESTQTLMDNIEKHLRVCDNEATDLQLENLAVQMPSMLQRIEDAYRNTRDFVTFIKDVLPAAKINFVSKELAMRGFTPSVFSLDLPTQGSTDEERESYKRALNLRLINLMIQEIPDESKYCVSYGQLKGCYWTIPATSTQGTTKEDDKDYIARVAISPDMDLDRHKKVFLKFVESI